MSQIGTMTTGAGIVTVLNLQFFPEFIMVKDVTGLALSAVSWNIAGKELVNINGANDVTAFANFKQNVITSVPGIATILTTGEGYLANQQFQLRLTNSGANTNAIFAFSRRRGNGRVIMSSQNVILDGANQKYTNFLSLAFLPDNVSRVDITFKQARTGTVFTDSFLVAELAALLALDNQTVTGTYSTLLTLDNTNLLNQMGSFIEECTIYSTGGNVTVTSSGIGAL